MEARESQKPVEGFVQWSLMLGKWGRERIEGWRKEWIDGWMS